MNDLTQKTVEELEARQAEIAGENRDEMTTEDIEARAGELEAIQAELEARKAAALKAEEERRAVEAGAGETKEEMKQEEKRMEVSEIRNTPEYINAYANYIKTVLEVSAVAFPAYPQTDLQAASQDGALDSARASLESERTRLKEEREAREAEAAEQARRTAALERLEKLIHGGTDNV